MEAPKLKAWAWIWLLVSHFLHKPPRLRGTLPPCLQTSPESVPGYLLCCPLLFRPPFNSLSGWMRALIAVTASPIPSSILEPGPALYISGPSEFIPFWCTYLPLAGQAAKGFCQQEVSTVPGEQMGCSVGLCGPYRDDSAMVCQWSHTIHIDHVAKVLNHRFLESW